MEANREESGDSPSIGKAGTACRIEGTRHSLDPTWVEAFGGLYFFVTFLGDVKCEAFMSSLKREKYANKKVS